MMEFYLEKWIERKFKDMGSINGPQTRNQALALYNKLIKKKKNKDPPPFAAIVEWFDKFKKRFDIKHTLYERRGAFICRHTCCYFNSSPTHQIILSHVGLLLIFLIINILYDLYVF